MSESQSESENLPASGLEPPPTVFAAYPREGAVILEPPGSPDQLLALSQGFPWLILSFVASLVVMFFLWGLPGDMRGLTIPPQWGGLAVAVIAYFGCRKVIFGLGGSQATAIICAIVIGATSPFCIGIFLIAILMNRTANQVFKYGVRCNGLGAFRRSEVLVTARRMREPGA